MSFQHVSLQIPFLAAIQVTAQQRDFIEPSSFDRQLAVLPDSRVEAGEAE